MAKGNTRHFSISLRSKLAVFVVLFSVLASGLVLSQDTYAANCPASRQSCNAPEQVSRNRCANPGGQQGAMWFNTSNNSATDTGYYSAQVNVTAAQNTVTVSLRGSVNTCNTPGSGTSVYAVNIASAAPNAGRLYNLQSTVLNRGIVPRTGYTWSSQGSSVTATLDVTGLATNNAGHTDTQTINIGVYRCFSTRSDRPTGACFATNVPVTVTRAAGIDFNLTPSITGTPAFTDGDSTGANKATLSPSVNNTGSTASTNTIQWRIVHFNVAPNLAIPGGGDSGTIPETFYGNGAVAIANGTGQTFAKNVTNLSVSSQVIGDFPIGTRICYALSVQPITQSNAAWRHSAPFCVTIAKSPKFQVHGGDIRVGSNFVDQTPTSGSNIITSQTTKNL